MSNAEDQEDAQEEEEEEEEEEPENEANVIGEEVHAGDADGPERDLSEEEQKE